MTKTPNYELPQWQPTDITSWMSEDGLNGAFSKIDSAMADNAGAASGAQSTATNAINSINNLNSQLALLQTRPQDITSDVVLTKLPGVNKTHWSLDRVRGILYVNGYLAYASYPTGGSLDLFKSEILKPSELRTIDAGCMIYIYRINSGASNTWELGNYSNIFVQPNGTIQIGSEISDFTGLNCRIMINLSLNVNSWGLNL